MLHREVKRGWNLYCDVCRKCVCDKDKTDHWHCQACPDFDICSDCVDLGNVCENLNLQHGWVLSTIDEEGDIIRRKENQANRVFKKATKSYPSLFKPVKPTDTPQTAFANEHRFIAKKNTRQILIYTDGACLDNGSPDAKAGYAFVYRPSAYNEHGVLTHSGTVGCRLESLGPTGQYVVQTSNRAELRAVIAALQFQDWSADCNGGWRSLVIATDSEYVAKGATEWIKRWEVRRWATDDDKPVANQDLWRSLMSEIRRLEGRGISILFWRIPREWNTRADQFAKKAVGGDDIPRFIGCTLDGPRGRYKILEN